MRENDNRGITRSERGQAMEEQPWIHTSAGMTIKVGLLHIGDDMNSGSEIQTKSGFVSAEQQLPG